MPNYQPSQPITKGVIALIVGAILFVILLIVSFMAFGKVDVQGAEVCVWQNWSGIKPDVSYSGTYFYCKWYSTPYIYYVGADTFVVDDKIENPNNTYMSDEEREHNQCDVEPLSIPVAMEALSEQDKKDGKTTGPTPVLIRCNIQFHIDPTHVIKLHKEKTSAYRTTFMKGIIIDSLISHTTVLDARTVYVGSGRIKLESDIDTALKSDSRFQDYGIVIEKFVLKDAELLDKSFLDKMTAESRAEQTRKTAEKQTLASMAEADAAKAAAQAEQNTRLVEADTKKKEIIAQSEAAAQQAINEATATAEQVRLAAKADADKVVMAANAEKARMIASGEGERGQKEAQAAGVLALGQATAAAQQLMFKTYEGVSGARFTQMEVAKAFGQGIQKIYYVPDSMKLTTIAEDFNKAINIGLPSDAAPTK